MNSLAYHYAPFFVGFFPFYKVVNRDVVFSQAYYYYYTLEATPNYLVPFFVRLKDEINETDETKVQPHCFLIQFLNLIKNEKRLNFLSLFDINSKLETYYQDVFDSFGREFSVLNPLKVDKLREDTITCYLFKNFKLEKGIRVKYPALAFYYDYRYPKLFDNFHKIDHVSYLSMPNVEEVEDAGKLYRNITYGNVKVNTLVFLRHIVIQLPYKDYITSRMYFNFGFLSSSVIRYQVNDDYDYSSEVEATAVFKRNEGVVALPITKTHFINVFCRATYNSDEIETFQSFLIVESSVYNAYYKISFKEYEYEAPERLVITRRWMDEEDLDKQSYGRYITIILHSDKDRVDREVSPNEYDDPEKLLEAVYFYVQWVRENQHLLDTRYFLDHCLKEPYDCPITGFRFLLEEDVFNLLYQKPYKITVYQRKPRIEKRGWIGRRKLICY